MTSANQEYIYRAILKSWNSLVCRLILSKRKCFVSLLVTIFVVGCLTFAGFCWIIEKYRWYFLLTSFCYASFYFLIKLLYLKYPSKCLDMIRGVTSLPLAILYVLLIVSIPFTTIVGTFLCVFLFSFGVPAIILTGLSQIGLLTLKSETIMFVVFVLGSTICSNSYSIAKWIIRKTPLRDRGNHRYETYREKLAVYLIHPSNVVFLLYSVYFVFLGVSGFLHIEAGKYLISHELDAAMLKAFLVFIAFTNMRTKYKETQVDAKELFIKTMKLFVRDR